jgi:hypothetical protein
MANLYPTEVSSRDSETQKIRNNTGYCALASLVNSIKLGPNAKEGLTGGDCGEVTHEMAQYSQPATTTVDEVNQFMVFMRRGMESVNLDPLMGATAVATPRLHPVYIGLGDQTSNYTKVITVKMGYDTKSEVCDELHRHIAVSARAAAFGFSASVDASMNSTIRSMLTISNCRFQETTETIRVDNERPCFVYQGVFDVAVDGDPAPTFQVYPNHPTFIMSAVPLECWGDLPTQQ